MCGSPLRPQASAKSTTRSSTSTSRHMVSCWWHVPVRLCARASRSIAATAATVHSTLAVRYSSSHVFKRCLDFVLPTHLAVDIFTVEAYERTPQFRADHSFPYSARTYVHCQCLVGPNWLTNANRLMTTTNDTSVTATSLSKLHCRCHAHLLKRLHCICQACNTDGSPSCTITLLCAYFTLKADDSGWRSADQAQSA